MQNKWKGKVRSPKLIVATILVLASFFAFHQEAIAGITGKIAGTVRDSETGETLPAANCILVGTDLGAACDSEGDYFIINVPPGTYSLEIRMMGYESVTQTGIEVDVDHTTRVDFELRPVAVAVPGITVVARREVIKMDLSSSSVVAESEEISAVPLVKDVGEYVNLQAGVEGWEIRGGGLDQTAFMIDGLIVVDNRANELLAVPNISSIKELAMIKGGFNAEYGNVRSGVINVITREGSPSAYHGSIDFRISPPHRKHGGPSLFSRDNFYLRPFLDTDVCWDGTKSGGWDEETQSQYKEFIGWVAFSDALLSDDDPTNDRTPEECRDLFMWLHRCEGSEALGQKEGHYGDKLDWTADLGFGGPVIPGFDKLSFFASYRSNWEAFALPTSRDYYKEDNVQLKLTSRISPSMKLSIEGLYGKINSVAREVDTPGDNDYVRGGDGIFWSALGEPEAAYNHRAGSNIYWPSSLAPFDVHKDMQGIAFDHALSPNTFYNLRLVHAHVRNFCDSSLIPWRDTTTIRYFGNTPIDEAPYGFWWVGGYKETTDGMLYSAIGAGARDWSEVNTINFKGDLTSQINKYNQIKVGLTVNYDDIHTHYEKISQYCPGDEWKVEWKHSPIRNGAYLQDKIELGGMIANVGVRLDYSNANCDWYTLDRYSKYFSRKYKDVFTEVTPTESAKSHLKVSPRLGISHPVSENAKLYFNYGHFYSMAPSRDIYGIEYGTAAYGIDFIGNPSAELPITVAYELGYEHNIANLFLLHLAGYYKDVSDQTGEVSYTNYDKSVDYLTIENNNYEDIRGFEVSLYKRAGKWITGWINYDYMVTTSGYIGLEHYFQDERVQLIYKLQNPYQERPIARPVLRANIRFAIPEDWGPTVAGIKPLGDFHLNFLYSWRAGRWMTWDPLATYKLVGNLQWKGYSNLDLRLSKDVIIGGSHIGIFMDVYNLLDTKRLADNGFSDSEDYRRYLYSLHLPMYKGEEYEIAGFVGGNDKPGDIKSEDKPHIDMPNREFLTYLDLRTISFGLRISF